MSLADFRPRVPVWKIHFNGVAADEYISDLVESLTVADNLEGEADDVDLTLNNFDLRWLKDWKMIAGDIIRVSFGYLGEDQSIPIEFELDKASYRFCPDSVSLRGQATPVTGQLREKRSFAYEKTTLALIAGEVAKRNNLELVGLVPAIQIKRATQKNETDLHFLRRLGKRFGIIFKVESLRKLVFYDENQLEGEPTTVTLRRSDLHPSSRMEEDLTDTYKSCTVQYKNPKTGKLLTHIEYSKHIKVGGTLKIVGERFENQKQAILRAREALRQANALKIRGTLDLEGEIWYIAGMNLELTEFGSLSGIYQVRSVRHALTQSGGYKCSLKVRSLALAEEEAEEEDAEAETEP